MHGDGKDDDVAGQIREFLYRDRIHTKEVKKTALDVSNESYVSEERRSAIEPEDFLSQWASRVQLGAQVLYILSLCSFVILNEVFRMIS